MAQFVLVLQPVGPMDDERGGDAAFVGVTLVHAEWRVAEVGPAAAGAGGPAAASAPFRVVVHACLRVTTVFSKESSPIVHARAGHAVVHHEEE